MAPVQLCLQADHGQSNYMYMYTTGTCTTFSMYSCTSFPLISIIRVMVVHVGHPLFIHFSSTLSIQAVSTYIVRVHVCRVSFLDFFQPD